MHGVDLCTKYIVCLSFEVAIRLADLYTDLYTILLWKGWAKSQVRSININFLPDPRTNNVATSINFCHS